MGAVANLGGRVRLPGLLGDTMGRVVCPGAIGPFGATEGVAGRGANEGDGAIGRGAIGADGVIGRGAGVMGLGGVGR